MQDWLGGGRGDSFIILKYVVNMGNFVLRKKGREREREKKREREKERHKEERVI